MPGWVVVADDLTGALDAAAALAPHGGGQVLLGPDVAWPAPTAVLAVSTRTRDGQPAAAPERVGVAVDRALDRDASVLLKIDSLLRGPVGAAVRAALARLEARRGRCVAVVAPAFPARGRTTRAGRVEVDGDHGSGGRDVVVALAAAGLRSVVLERGAPLPPVDDLPPGTDAVVVDCDSDEDLARLAAEVRSRPDVLPVGTAGLAAALATPRSHAGRQGPPLRGRALVAIGSLAPAAVAQVAAAVHAGIAHVPVSTTRADAGRRAGELLVSGHVLLTPAPSDVAEDAVTVAGRLGAAVHEAVGRADLLVLSGGHTAQVVLDRLGVSRLELVAELEPGVVASRMPGRPQLVVTKAGAFGDDGTLVRLLDWAIESSSEGRGAS